MLEDRPFYMFLEVKQLVCKFPVMKSYHTNNQRTVVNLAIETKVCIVSSFNLSESFRNETCFESSSQLAIPSALYLILQTYLFSLRKTFKGPSIAGFQRLNLILHAFIFPAKILILSCEKLHGPSTEEETATYQISLVCYYR